MAVAKKTPAKKAPKADELDAETVAASRKLEEMPVGTAILIPPIRMGRLKVRIEGMTTLIMSNFSNKSKEQMAGKQQKKAQGPREAKDPRQCFEDAKLLNENDEDCFKAISIRAAAVRAAKQVAGVDMVGIRTSGLTVTNLDGGKLVPIECSECTMEEDPVRNQGGTADLRYRPYYHNWAGEILVEWCSDILTAEQVLNLINMGGAVCGIGEWRPEKGPSGWAGKFSVTEANTVSKRGRTLAQAAE